MIYPVKGFRVTQGFGVNNGFRYGKHQGIDFATPTGTPVKAAQSGTVVFAGWGGDAGNAVTIQNGKVLAKVFHLSKVSVKNGQQVKEGQVIGNSGNTGYSTGPHLHFQTEINRVPVDPKKLIEVAKPKPAPAYPKTVTVKNAVAYVRNQPTSKSKLDGSRILPKFTKFRVVGAVKGENVGGNNKWYKTIRGNYVWSGAVK